MIETTGASQSNLVKGERSRLISQTSRKTVQARTDIIISVNSPENDQHKERIMYYDNDEKNKDYVILGYIRNLTGKSAGIVYLLSACEVPILESSPKRLRLGLSRDTSNSLYDRKETLKIS